MTLLKLNIHTPDGPISSEELVNTKLDDMWEHYPTLAYWLWDNDQMTKIPKAYNASQYYSMGWWDD